MTLRPAVHQHNSCSSEQQLFMFAFHSQLSWFCLLRHGLVHEACPWLLYTRIGSFERDRFRVSWGTTWANHGKPIQMKSHISHFAAPESTFRYNFGQRLGKGSFGEATGRLVPLGAAIAKHRKCLVNVWFLDVLGSWMFMVGCLTLIAFPFVQQPSRRKGSIWWVLDGIGRICGRLLQFSTRG